MKLKLTAKGVTVPRDLLDDAEVVEVVKRNDMVVVVPLSPDSAEVRDDPIFGLGRNPVDTGLVDGAERHDHSLSNPPGESD